MASQHHQQKHASTEHMVEYDKNSYMQDQLVLSKFDDLCKIVAQIGVVTPEFVMMDYGCGPGHSAIDSVRPVVEAYRKINRQATIIIRHADQPGNDWNALFTLAFGSQGYRRDDASIRSEAAIGSFYTEMAPPGSVALGTCFAASHWLSRAIYVNSPGTVWFADLEGDARKEFAECARADWTQFLCCRARELRTGGYLMVSTLGSVPDAGERNQVKASARKLYRAIFEVARQMVDDGVLSASALDRFVFSLWFPTAEEARRPIDQEPDLAAAFEVVEAHVGPAAAHPDDVYEDDIGDTATYARLYAGYVRGFGESLLRLHLFGPAAKSPQEIDALTEYFFHRFEKYYRDQPGKHASETMILTLILRRC